MTLPSQVSNNQLRKILGVKSVNTEITDLGSLELIINYGETSKQEKLTEGSPVT